MAKEEDSQLIVEVETFMSVQIGMIQKKIGLFQPCCQALTTPIP